MQNKVSAFNPKSNITAVFEPDLDIKELQIFATALFKTYSGIRAVFSECENGFSFAFCGESQSLDAFFGEFKANFTVKGGGRNGMVQGTAQAKKEEIEKFFEDRK